jgi:hypothetical protein
MDRLVSTVDILFKVALALIAAYTSYQFGAFRQQNDDAKLVVDLAFAQEPRTAMAGVVLAGTYLKSGRIPPDLYTSIVASANSNGDPQLRDTANNGATEIASSNRVVAKKLTQVLATLPVRVYFQISREADRARAKQTEDLLQNHGPTFNSQSVVVPGIQFVKQARTKTEVRCFKTAECNDFGSKLVTFLAGVGISSALVDLSDRYGNSESIRPYHFEIWFGPLS